MRTFEKFIVEAEGFQGKMTPGHDAKKGAITLNNNLNKRTPSKPGALAKRAPGGRGVGSTQSPYKTGALAKRVADKGGQLVRSKNYKEPTASRPDEKKTGEKEDGWGRKPAGDFKGTGTPEAKTKAANTPVASNKKPHNSSFRDGVKQGVTGGLMGGTPAQRKAAKRSLGRKIGSDVRNAPGNFVKNALKNPSKDVDSVEGKEGKSAGRMQKQY